MFNKSFAEVLKENLTDESFKPPDKTLDKTSDKTLDKTSGKTLDKNKDNYNISDQFRSEIHKYYLNLKDLDKIYGSRSFYKKLFKEPVKMIFYWCEEDWQGSLFVVYSYKNKYIYTKGYFGSCEVCDAFPDTEETLIKKFNSLEICEDINDISIHGRYSDCTHPELVKDFEKFKTKILKHKRKLTQYTYKESTQSIEEEVKNDNKEIKKPISWASLFK